MQTFKFDNGQRGSFRQVTVSPEGVCRDVVKVIRSEKRTIQEAFPGDFLFKEGRVLETVSIISENGVPIRISNIVKEAEAWRFCPAALQLWLSEGKTSSLPEGYGWNGEVTNKEARKIAATHKFFKGLEEKVIEQLAKIAKYSPRSGMPMDWAKVERDTLPSSIYMDDDPSTSWVVWTFDNKVKLVNKVSSTKNIRGAAKLHLGAYRNAKGTYGVKWELFRK
jgi:hypothetical protein